MNFLQAAMAAVQRHLPALGIYTGGVMLAYALGLAVDLLLTGGEPVNPGAISGAERVYGLIVELAQAPILAAASAVAFARIGKDLDRPLWRSPDDRDALARFFQLWLVLILLGTMLGTLYDFADAMEALPLAVLSQLFYLLLFLVTVPVGACIMFNGPFQWRELGRALAPLGRNLPRTFVLIAINLFQLWLVFRVAALRQSGEGMQWLWISPFVILISAYLDCVVFSGTWLLCIENRNADEDPDFDF